jgi:hypothetical protein
MGSFRRLSCVALFNKDAVGQQQAQKEVEIEDLLVSLLFDSEKFSLVPHSVKLKKYLR